VLSARPAAARPRRGAGSRARTPDRWRIKIGGKLVSSPARGHPRAAARSRSSAWYSSPMRCGRHMTVRQNVVIRFKHREIARSEATARSPEVLELVGLTELPPDRWWRRRGGQIASAWRWRAASSIGRQPSAAGTKPLRIDANWAAPADDLRAFSSRPATAL